MRDALRNIFSRFQNLNLRVLIDDLKRGQVAKGKWSSYRDFVEPMQKLFWTDSPEVEVSFNYRSIRQVEICPMLHGACTALEGDSEYRCEVLGRQLGVPEWVVHKFIQWWDRNPPVEVKQTLLSVLEDIWQERLTDANAVQEVITDVEFPASTHSQADAETQERAQRAAIDGSVRRDHLGRSADGQGVGQTQLLLPRV